MIKSTFDLENALSADGYKFIIGIDEAGRGPLAGPVIASAVALRNFQFPSASRRTNFQTNSNNQISNDKNWDFVRDSKTLSEKQREKMFDFVHEHFYVGVGICDHETIDRVNILEATYLAMKTALSDLRGKINYKDWRHIIVVDGNKKIPNLSLEQKAIVNGDRLVKSISAASIIAKVTRDRIMLEMHAKYPEYNFAQHKGYGTKMHFAMLEKNGPCEIHRRSFAPVKKSRQR
ncbi:MAG: ribonuclease HII [Parcubacteria group bacterium]|jgi:ribonuclease HII